MRQRKEKLMLDIESFMFRHFIDVRTYGNPTSDLRIHCPFCTVRYGSEDNQFKLYISINSDKPVVHCFRCGYGSSWIGFVMKVTGLNRVQAYGELYIVPNPTNIDHWEGDETEPIVEDTVNLPDDFISLISKKVNDVSFVKVARTYMRKRGFSRDHLALYNIGIAESIQWRIIIPIEEGYWQARALIESTVPKYINPKSSARHYLFNSQALEIYDEVVITEGAFSAMAIDHNAVAIIGKDCTNEKIHRFTKSNVKRFILAIEPDAFPTMYKLADTLYNKGKEVVIWNYKEGDPADPVAKFEVRNYNMRTKMELLLG